MVSSKKKKKGVFKKKKKKRIKKKMVSSKKKKKKIIINGVFKKKKKKKIFLIFFIWVGIQHGLRRSRVCILSYSTTVDMTGYLFIFYLYSFFCILYFVLFFLFLFFFLFEDTIEKFRLLIQKFTRNLPETFPKLTRPFSISLFIKLGTWMHHQE